MSIDVLSCRGHAPVVVMDDDWLPRVLGFYRTPEFACLEVLDPENQPVMIQLQENTREAATDAVLVYYVAIAGDNQIKNVLAAPIDSPRFDGFPVSADDLKARLARLVGGPFNVEHVDLALVGKIEEETFSQVGTASQCDLPDRPQQSRNRLLSS